MEFPLRMTEEELVKWAAKRKLQLALFGAQADRYAINKRGEALATYHKRKGAWELEGVRKPSG